MSGVSAIRSDLSSPATAPMRALVELLIRQQEHGFGFQLQFARPAILNFHL
jgi:hypothetical protein